MIFRGFCRLRVSGGRLFYFWWFVCFAAVFVLLIPRRAGYFLHWVPDRAHLYHVFGGIAPMPVGDGGYLLPTPIGYTLRQIGCCLPGIPRQIGSY